MDRIEMKIRKVVQNKHLPPAPSPRAHLCALNKCTSALQLELFQPGTGLQKSFFFFWVTFLGECMTNSVVDNKDKSVEVLQFHSATACLRLGDCGSDLKSVEAFSGTLCPFEVLL